MKHPTVYSLADFAGVTGLSPAAAVSLDRTGIVRPSYQAAAGPGRPRGYLAADVERGALLGACWRAGLPAAAFRAALELAAGAGDAGRLAVAPRSCDVVLLAEGAAVPDGVRVVSVFGERARVAAALAELDGERLRQAVGRLRAGRGEVAA